ncbi:MAG TPA: amino acid ABC transporter substrate-binding protein [Euzebyales bacterium]|nr:amino acid ABC transporter substrate-binding protein [Euzebyales bacterium]
MSRPRFENQSATVARRSDPSAPRPRRVHRLLCLLAVLTLVLAACGGEDPTAAGGDTEAPGATSEGPESAATGGEDLEGDPIRIGVSLPLTGDFSEPGKGVQNGYDTWATMVNESGGLLGRPVEMIYRDDASDPNRVISDYEQLITQEEVDMVLGPFSSRLVLAAADVAERNDMLFIEPAGAAPEIFEQGFENLFYAAPAVADTHYEYLFEYIEGLPEGERPETVAYAVLDDPFAMGTANGLKSLLEEAGYETVADEVYPPDQTDFAAIAARVADTNADMFVGGTQFEDSVGLIRAFQELGYQPKMATFSTGPTLPQFSEAVAGASEGILSPVGYSSQADLPGNAEFVAKYQELFDEEPGEDPANGYTAGQILAAAVEEVECADPSPECQQELIDHLHGATVETIVGELSWDEAGRPQGAHMIQQWIDGRIEIVLPDTEVKTTDLVYPKPEW